MSWPGLLVLISPPPFPLKYFWNGRSNWVRTKKFLCPRHGPTQLWRQAYIVNILMGPCCPEYEPLSPLSCIGIRHYHWTYQAWFLWPHAGDSASLCLSVLVYKMMVIILPMRTSVVQYWTKEGLLWGLNEIIHMKHSTQRQVYGKCPQMGRFRLVMTVN